MIPPPCTLQKNVSVGKNSILPACILLQIIPNRSHYTGQGKYCLGSLAYEQIGNLEHGKSLVEFPYIIFLPNYHNPKELDGIITLLWAEPRGFVMRMSSPVSLKLSFSVYVMVSFQLHFKIQIIVVDPWKVMPCVVYILIYNDILIKSFPTLSICSAFLKFVSYKPSCWQL